MSWIEFFSAVQIVVRPLLDVVILAYLIYQMYQILVQTRAVALLRGAVLIGLIYTLAFLLKLDTLLWIMNRMTTVLVLVLAVVFQPELRSIFTRIGRGQWFKFHGASGGFSLDGVLNAAEVLAGMRRGALVVFSRRVGLKNIMETGTRLNAELSSSLVLTIFSYDTPLHDGALVIHQGQAAAAGCFLPLSDQANIRRSFGTRHRAALGLAEETDAVVLVVSEETGAISLAYDANLYYDLTPEEVRKTLIRVLEFREEEDADEEPAYEES